MAVLTAFISEEDLREKLETGIIRVKVNDKLKQYTRNYDSVLTCPCKQGEKKCGLIANEDFLPMLKTWDKDGKIGVYEMGSNMFERITPNDIEKIIRFDEVTVTKFETDVEEVPACCKETENTND